MEIKILCSCGNKYKFDLEPVNGRAPANLSCPQCKASWTEYANAFIARELGLPQAPSPTAAPPPPPPRPISLPAMPPATQAPAVGKISLSPAPVAEAHPAGRLSLSPTTAPEAAPGPRISLSPAPAPAQAEAALAPAGEGTPAPIRPMPAVPKFVPPPSDAEGGLTAGFGLGVLGGILGAALGGLIFYLVFHYTGKQIKLVAIGVGFLAGLGARLLGKKGCMELGLITGILTIAGIVGAEYCFAKSLWNIGEEPSSKSSYEEAVKGAKETLKAVPNGTDEEIRNFLAKEDLEPGEKPDPKSVTKEDINDFRKELPEIQDLASGKITKEEFEKKEEAKLAKFADKDKTDPAEEKKKQDTYFNYFFVIVFLNRFNLVCIAAAVGLAYKMTDS